MASDSTEKSFPDIMTVDQLAAYLQLNPQVVYRHVREGRIPVSRIGQSLRFPKQVIDAWLEEGAWDSIGTAPTPKSEPPVWDAEAD